MTTTAPLVVPLITVVDLTPDGQDITPATTRVVLIDDTLLTRDVVTDDALLAGLRDSLDRAPTIIRARGNFDQWLAFLDALRARVRS